MVDIVINGKKYHVVYDRIRAIPKFSLVKIQFTLEDTEKQKIEQKIKILFNFINTVDGGNNVRMNRSDINVNKAKTKVTKKRIKRKKGVKQDIKSNLVDDNKLNQKE
jgi:hypothetical protein